MSPTLSGDLGLLTYAMHLGIDLGTTNSVAALHDGDGTHIVRNAQGGILTPSVVRIDARGNVSVGAKARRFLEADPTHTKSEWKRLLGSGRKLTFGDGGTEKSPRELSAIILQSLRRDVEAQVGFLPRSCVITVPALFEIPQISDTAAAASLAGFERVEMLQEPVASALAAGHRDEGDDRPWLVYDLGGGTFDVSLVELRDGLLRVVGHDGDNFLGGRDFDSALVEYVLGTLEGEHGAIAALRSPALAGARARLRAAVEDAKIELTRERTASVTLPNWVEIDGNVLDVDVDIDRSTFERLTLPLVDRSIDVCLRLLRGHGIADDALARVVLVGGPTVIPNLRARVRDRLSAPFGEGLDPMTLVAEGAAAYARSLDLDSRVRAHAPEPPGPARDGPRAWLQFPAVSADPQPYLVGRMLALTEGVVEVRAVRGDGQFTSTVERVDAEGTFAVAVELVRRATSRFVIEGRKAGGAFQPVHPEIGIQHGTTLGDPPLARTLGVALADGTVRVYVERGSPLPVRRSFRHKTAAGITAGSQDEALVIPIVQGESALARLCRVVGELRLDGTRLSRSVSAGTEVDVSIELDRAGRLTTTAAIPSQGISFEGVASLVTPSIPVEALAPAIAVLTDRVVALRRRAFASGRPNLIRTLGAADDMLREIESGHQLAVAGDVDSLERCRRLMVDLDETLSTQEDSFTVPDMLDELDDLVASATFWATTHGSDTDRRMLEDASTQILRLREAPRLGELERLRRRIVEIRLACYRKWPESWAADLEHWAGRVGESTDPRRAEEWVRKGRAAAQRSDVGALRTAVIELAKLMPPSAREGDGAHGSGVR